MRWMRTVFAVLLLISCSCAGSRTVFENGLQEYPDAWDDRKLRHAALHFLVAEFAKKTPKITPEHRLLGELDGLDIHDPRDSGRWP